jgi:hypothetical protein
MPYFIPYCCSLHSVTVRRLLRDVAAFRSVRIHSPFLLLNHFKSSTINIMHSHNCAGTAISHFISRAGTGHAIDMSVLITRFVREHKEKEP